MGAAEKAAVAARIYRTVTEFAHHTGMSDLRFRLRAAGLHLAASAAVAAVIAGVAFGLWFPAPYRQLSDALPLFLLIAGVDLVLGPFVTGLVFRAAKPAAERRRDVGVVVLLQLMALGYGVWVLHLARPVHLVFEIDRFRVVHAADVPEDLLAAASPQWRSLPLTGPTLIAARPFRSPTESADATLAALQGVAIGARPDFWQDYAAAVPRVLERATPVSTLYARFPNQRAAIDAAVGQTGRRADDLRSLPLVSREHAWTVLLDARSAQPLAFLPLDSF